MAVLPFSEKISILFCNWLCIEIAHLTEYGFDDGALDLTGYFMILYCLFQQPQHFPVRCQRVIYIRICMAIAHIMEAGPENAPLDHLLLYKGFQLQWIACCGVKAHHC